MNFTVNERLLVDFIGIESWWHLLKGSSSMFREGTWSFTKGSDWSHWFYITKSFIEAKLFHDKRRNLTVYEKFPVDFICSESSWHQLKWSSSRIKEGSWPFTNSSESILLVQSRHQLIEGDLFHDKRMILIVYEVHQVDFIGTELSPH
jgi:hypothetical protein